MKKKALIAAASVLAVLLLLTFGAAWYMLDYALTPAADARDMAKRYSLMYAEYPYMRHWVDSMKSVKALRDTFIIMPDGERHHAVYARADSAAGRTAVLVHGYKDSHAGMLPIAKVYADMGYNILLPDLHAHGLSEGTAIQMGWKDREDVMRWIGLADSLFATNEGRPRIVVHGVSMGAAASLPTSSVCRRSRCSMPPARCANCATDGRSARRRRLPNWAGKTLRCSSSTARQTLTCRRRWSFRCTTPTPCTWRRTAFRTVSTAYGLLPDAHTRVLSTTIRTNTPKE